MATNSATESKTENRETLGIEADVIQLAQAGDEDAFSVLYERNVDAITRYIQHRVTDLDEAENLTQVVFVKAWQALGRYQTTKIPFRAWLYRIARNTVIDYYRTRKDATDIDSQWNLADQRSSPEEAVLSAERSATVRNAINQLKPSYRQVLSLRFLDDRDYPETALLLDRNVNAVRVLQHRALGALQKVLSNEQTNWIVTVVAILSLAFGGSVTLAAERSVPGDSLYPIKRTIESSLLGVTGATLDVRLQMRFADRRVDELSRLIDSGREADLALATTEYIEQVRSMTASLLLLMEAEPALEETLTADVVQALETQIQQISEYSSRGPDAIAPALKSAISASRQAQAAIEQLAPSEQLPTPMPQFTPNPPAVTPASAPNSASEQDVQLDPTAPASTSDAPAKPANGIEVESGSNAHQSETSDARDDHPGATAPSTHADKQPSARQAQNRTNSKQPRSEGQTQPIDLLPQAATIVQALLTDLDLSSRPTAPFSPPRVSPRRESVDEAPTWSENEVPSQPGESQGHNTISPPQPGSQSDQAASVQEPDQAPSYPDAQHSQSQTGPNPAGNESLPDRQDADRPGDGHQQNRNEPG
jgi:RNA polymerase sigma-70 factor (ECF subfamily)